MVSLYTFPRPEVNLTESSSSKSNNRTGSYPAPKAIMSRSSSTALASIKSVTGGTSRAKANIYSAIDLYHSIISMLEVEVWGSQPCQGSLDELSFFCASVHCYQTHVRAPPPRASSNDREAQPAFLGVFPVNSDSAVLGNSSTRSADPVPLVFGHAFFGYAPAISA